VRSSLLSLAVVAGLVAAAPAAAVDPALLAADAPDVVFTASVAAKADELGNDPVRIYEFLRGEFEYQPYYGLMKGPEATLASRGGNDYDMAALLVSMLRHSGIPARFARGFIEVAATDARDWTGAAYSGIVDLWRAIEPPGWSGTFFSATQLSTPTRYRRLHVWVEALVPMARYRGSDLAPADERGRVWVPLDASFKLRDFPLTVDPLGLTTNPPAVAFGYGVVGEASPGPEPYYATASPKLPSEIYADRLRAHVAGTAVAGTSPESLESKLFAGPVRRQEPGVLPTALPYEVVTSDPGVGFFAPLRSARLSDLHESIATGGLSPDARVGADGDKDYRYPWAVHVCKSSLNRDQCATHADDSNVLLRHAGRTAALAGQRVILNFPPVDPGAIDQETGFAGVSCGSSGRPTVRPTLRIAGIDQGLGFDAPKYCDQVQLVVEVDGPLDVAFAAQGPVRHGRLVKAGGIYGIAVETHDGSPDRTQAAAAGLVQALETDFPVVDQPLSGGGTGKFVTTSQKFLAVDFVAQEALFGGLLNLVGKRYFEMARGGQRRLNELQHYLMVLYPGMGLIVSDLANEYLFDIPFSTKPAKPLVDMSLANRLLTRTGSNAVSQAGLLMGHEISAAEHAVWEEVSGLEAVSTAKGHQLLTLNDEPVHVVASTGDAQDLLGTCTSGGCTGVDRATYCILRDEFVNGGAIWTYASSWNSWCGAPQNNPAISELWIAASSEFQYLQWTGQVFVGRSAIAIAFVIAGTTASNGGETATDWITLDPWAYVSTPPPPNQQSVFVDFDIPTFEYNTPGIQAVQVGDPVAITTGNLSHIEKDLEIPGPGGFNLRFVRTYNSRSDHVGALGHGWIHSYEQHLRIEGAAPDQTVVWVDENGVESAFDLDAASGALVPRPGIHHELVEEPSGAYTLTTRGGIKYRFLADQNADGKALLDSIEGRNYDPSDPNANRVRCEYDAPEGRLQRVWLIDAAGTANERKLELGYDDTGVYLRKISDWTGRHWRYVVDANGDLESFLDPEEDVGSGKRTRYTYYTSQSSPALNHNLKRVTLPADRAAPAGGDVWMDFFYYGNDTVHRHVNAAGETTLYSYNFTGRRTTVIQPDGAIEGYAFDRYGNTIRHESGRGVVREYGYDTAQASRQHDRILEVDGFGLETEAAYDGDGNMTSRTDRLGNTETWSHDPFGQPTRHVDRRGNERRWEYDARGNLLRELAELDGALRVLREHAYDARGNRTQTIEHLAATGGTRRTRFFYDPTGTALVRSVNAFGHETRFETDALGRPIATITTRTGPGGTPETIRTETVYDRLDRVVAQTDAAGVVGEIDYDPNGKIVERRTLLPLPGQPARVEESNTYDAADRLVQTENAIGGVTSFTYDPMGRVASVTTPLGHTTRNRYDADGNRVLQIDASGARWQWKHDPEGRVIEAIDPVGQVHKTSYDAEGRVLRVEGPGGRQIVENVEIDPAGNPILVEDGGGYRFRFEYDELGRRIRAAGPEDAASVPTADWGEARFTYDLEGRLLSKTDPESRTWRQRYDALGRLIEASDPLGRSRHFAWDEVGSLVETLSPANERIVHEYDSRGLRTRTRSADGAIDDRFSYDLLGRLVSARNANATYSVEYDDLDRPIALTDPRIGTARRVYDADGRITQVVYPARDPDAQTPGGFPEGIVTQYRYDARGLLTSVADPAGGTWTFTWDAAGRGVDRTYPGGVTRQVAYDTEGFVSKVEVFANNAIRDRTHYRQYDERGNPAQICEGLDCGKTAIESADDRLALAYDTLGRLKDVTYPDATQEVFAYDRSGSRKQHTPRTGPARRYLYDGAAQLDRIEDASTSALLEDFSYDAAGRRTQRTIAGGATTAYAYDPLGRLREVRENGSPVATLGYDAAGHRRSRTEAGGQVALYLGEWLEERSSGERVRLVHATGLDDVLGEVTELPGTASDVSRYLLPDAAGNVAAVAKAGVIESKLRYEAFGAPRTVSATTPVERRFAGRPYEGASSLVYLRARHYDPATGQFLQADPLGIATDHPYAYAANNPIVYADPFGLLPIAKGPAGGNLSGVSSITFEAEPGGGVDPSTVSSSSPIGSPGDSGGALGNHVSLASGTFPSSDNTGGSRSGPEKAFQRGMDWLAGQIPAASIGYLVTGGALVGNRGIDLAGGVGLTGVDTGVKNLVEGAGFGAAALNWGERFKYGHSRGFELGIDFNLLVMRERLSEAPNLSVVSVSFGTSIKLFVDNHGENLRLGSIRPRDILGVSWGAGPGIALSVVDSVGRGGAIELVSERKRPQ
jgi:RHS repeat-associated protein